MGSESEAVACHELFQVRPSCRLVGVRCGVRRQLVSWWVVSSQLLGNVHSLNSTGIALVIGLIVTFVGARGAARVMQYALNTAWEVPYQRRPVFPWSLLRSISLILAVGIGGIITGILSGFAGGVGHVITRITPEAGAAALSLVLNMGLFWLAFRRLRPRPPAAP